MREGWVGTTLGEVADIEMGQSPPGTTYNTKGDGLPFIQGSAEFGERHPTPVKWCSQPKKVAEAGDLLMSVRAPVGDLNIAAEKTAIGRGLARLRGTETLLTGFIAPAIHYALPELLARSGGGMFTSITKEGLSGLPLAIPPLTEQRRIVDLIAAVDENIAAAERTVREIGLLRDALEHEQFGTGGDEPITEFTEFAGGYAFGEKYQGETSGEIPFIKVSDMNHASNQVEMVGAANNVSRSTLAEMRAKSWPPGTVVFPKVGAALLTEKRRVLGVECAFDNNVMGLIPGPRIRSKYLLSFLRTIRLGEFAQHGAVPSVNQGHFSQVTIDLPSLAEQDRFIALIESVEVMLAASQGVLGSLLRSRSALLADLLSGDHEIPVSYDRLLEAS